MPPKPFSRKGGKGPGVPTPTHGADALVHVLTIDLDEAPELRAALTNKNARALSLYVPDPEGGTAYEESVVVEVPADGEIRVDWRVKAVAEGVATVRMLALTDEESDAMQMAFPVQVHGMLKQEAWSGVVRLMPKPSSVTSLRTRCGRTPA